MIKPTLPEDGFEAVPVQEAAAYLIEMLSSMSQFAHASDLNSSALILSAAARLVSQECKLIAAETSDSNVEQNLTELPYRA